MSSAFYPLGMNSYNNRVPQGGYKTWKGNGVYSNPIGVTAGDIRPLTNNDASNNTISKHGLPRPLKIYRKGTVVPRPESTNRQVKSSIGNYLITQLVDGAGSYSIKNNSVTNNNTIDNNCRKCDGIGMISSWYPINNLTEKPQSNVTSHALCCNEQKKARRRVLPASTILKKNYYTTTERYLYNRCQTFEQRSFNYFAGISNPEVYAQIIENNPFATPAAVAATKPGDPLSVFYKYNANCNPNVEINPIVNGVEIEQNLIGCKKTMYKPNNPKFAQQGGVSSSQRMLRVNVDTINKNIANIRKSTSQYIYKNKSPACNPAYFRKDGDHVSCVSV